MTKYTVSLFVSFHVTVVGDDVTPTLWTTPDITLDTTNPAHVTRQHSEHVFSAQGEEGFVAVTLLDKDERSRFYSVVGVVEVDARDLWAAKRAAMGKVIPMPEAGISIESTTHLCEVKKISDSSESGVTSSTKAESDDAAVTPEIEELPNPYAKFGVRLEEAPGSVARKSSTYRVISLSANRAIGRVWLDGHLWGARSISNIRVTSPETGGMWFRTQEKAVSALVTHHLSEVGSNS